MMWLIHHRPRKWYTPLVFVVVGCALTLTTSPRLAAAPPGAAPGDERAARQHIRVGATQPRDRTIDFRLSPDDALARVDRSLDELEALVNRAGGSGCDVVVFPEDTLGLLKWEAANPTEVARVVPKAVDRMIERLGSAAAAHRMYLVCCNDTLDDRGGHRNTAFFLGRDGKEIGRYHKVQPTFFEARKPGDAFPVFPTPDLGGVGMLICYDMVFPESARCLALGGADVVFHPTLGGAAIGNADVSRAAFRTRAVENFVYVVVSQRGDGSMVISPKGEILAEAEGADGIATADIDPFAGREGGDAFNQQRDMRARLFRERNPAAYRVLTDPQPPALSKLPVATERAEAERVAAQALTVGEEEFSRAEALAREGKTAEAVAAFEALRARYRGSWIDRVSAERLKSLRARARQ